MSALRDQGHTCAPTREGIHADAGEALWEGGLEQEGNLLFPRITESVRMEKPSDHQLQPMTKYYLVSQTMAPSVMSNLCLKTSMNSVSATSLVTHSNV